MSHLLIQQYLGDIDRVRRFSGVSNEQVIRPAFRRLIDQWASSHKLIFLEEYLYQTALKTKVYPDGTVLHDIRVPLGYWEAKDTNDDLDAEIAKKLRNGYPQDNIIFENSETAVLYQNRNEVLRCSMTDTAALLKLMNLFFSYERQEIAQFRKAVAQFKTDLPRVLDSLREKIDNAYSSNMPFRSVAATFLAHAKETINPSIGEADVREMLIQHILTEEIFTHIFDQGDFHRENNIAKALYALEGKFFTGAIKRDTLKGLEPYYATIRANAALITSHSEKQTFLKVIYENFYKVYNPKAADRLGVVYTPNEIVKFMVEGADWLCHKHFGRTLIDQGVEILDPATGTGTFVSELIQYFAWDKAKLYSKYRQELHANEVAILPYYVANLNIEATYFGITGQYAEFENLCFVDTLDNVDGLGIKTGHQHDMFAAVSQENIERVRRQNRRKISVIIGNPPYNANQQNENDNNKNRIYSHIDRRIKDTYINQSTAQKTKAYDMYARFFRWASDRLHDDGVLALVTNRSFIDSRTFDGFRRSVEHEFNEIYVIDLGGDVRANPKLSGTKNNVFGIQTGVAISFMVKRRRHKGCMIFYARRPEFETAAEKLSFLGSSKLSMLKFERIDPDKKGNWINLSENNWEALVPIADKKAKAAKSAGQEQAIFRLFSFGLVTNRDEWMFDRSEENLELKVSYLLKNYESDRKLAEEFGFDAAKLGGRSGEIKWTRSVKRSLQNNNRLLLKNSNQIQVLYRPFDKMNIMFFPPLIEMLNKTREIHGPDGRRPNLTLVFSDPTSQKPFMATASDCMVDMHLVGAAAGAVCLPRYRHTADGEHVDNITDWGLRQFDKHYGKGAKITKDEVFQYVYAVMHDPVYRVTYAANLKREFPRIPFYPEFRQWADWGARLMALHIGYETVEAWPLVRTDARDEGARAAGVAPKALLKADHDAGTIRLDSETTLSGIPAQAWTYLLGNRSGLDWILEQYKESTPKDPTIREKFNTYRFADYKDKVIDLIKRVTRVSVDTVAIIEAMKDAKRE
jgi:predicted helicase